MTELRFVTQVHGKICQQVANAGSPDSAYRLSTLLILKVPVQRCTAELWIGFEIDKILLDAEA
jgi:hypothetical protein